MQSFIGKLVEHLLSTHAESLGDLCVVFPSRRATVFFRDALLKAVEKASWAPEIMGIEDFVKELCEATVLDNVSLTFELYPIYKEVFPDEPFEKYYSWGSMLISDFDEIDRYLVKAEDIFSNLYELKRIDTTIEAWLNEDSKPSDFQLRYLRFWEVMGVLYSGLRSRLQGKALASGGMALRDLAEEFQEKLPPLKWKKIIFAGFNAISPSEEMLLKALVDHGVAECFWDMDEYYVDSEYQEAGRYFRELRERWKGQDWQALILSDPGHVNAVSQFSAAALRHLPTDPRDLVPDDKAEFQVLPQSLPAPGELIKINDDLLFLHGLLIGLIE